MKYVLFLSLLPFTLYSQPKVKGLGKYLLGVSTPDSLKKIDFNERLGESDTLVCRRVRTFEAATIDIAGIPVSDVTLLFYDDRLYEISCNLSDELQSAFYLKYGKGKPRARRTVTFCEKKGKTMSVLGEEWKTQDVLAIIAHSKGYDFDCEYVEDHRLTIYNEKYQKLGSDCQLANTKKMVDTSIKELNQYMNQLNKAETNRKNKIKKEL